MALSNRELDALIAAIHATFSPDARRDEIWELTQSYFLGLPPDVFKEVGDSLEEFQVRAAMYRAMTPSASPIPSTWTSPRRPIAGAHRRSWAECQREGGKHRATATFRQRPYGREPGTCGHINAPDHTKTNVWLVERSCPGRSSGFRHLLPTRTLPIF